MVEIEKTRETKYKNKNDLEQSLFQMKVEIRCDNSYKVSCEKTQKSD